MAEKENLLMIMRQYLLSKHPEVETFTNNIGLLFAIMDQSSPPIILTSRSNFTFSISCSF